MSSKEEILTLLHIEIEKKLYLIKENNFVYDNDFYLANSFKFEKDNIENKIYVKIDSKKYGFEDGCRLIDFVINGKTQKRFIYNPYYLISVLKELNIDKYSTGNFDNTNNSCISAATSQEIFNTFKDTKITTINKIQTGIDKIIEKFKSRFPNKIKKISDLSINAKFYFPDNYNDDLDFKFFSKECFKKYKNDIFSNLFNENIMYFIGPKGTSKSIFLMYSHLQNSIIYELPILYINYRKLNELDSKERKNIIKKESLYMFFEENKCRQFLKNKYYKVIKENEDFLIALKLYLQDLINKYKNAFTKSLIVIIDNFDEENEQKAEKMENIINLVKG